MSPEPKETKPWSNAAPDRVWDYIVVGSGMGGMTTAAMLAKQGRRVLVLEQHYTAGGFTHTFRRKKWTWDVGVHAIGEVDPRAAVGKVLLGLTDGKLEWASLGPVYDRFQFPDLQIDFPDNKAQFAENLKAAFPSESAAIDAYLVKVREVAGSMGRYWLSRVLPPWAAPVTDRLIAADAHRQLTVRTQEVLDGITPNQKLQAVLTSQWGYYGVPRARSSFAIHAAVARHFLRGGFYPVGSSRRIAETLLGTVAEAGGWTRIRASVKTLVVEKGRAVGVRLDDGQELRATRGVISAIGGLATVNRLLPEIERRSTWAQSIAKLKPSPAHVCLYLGFKGDIREAGASASNQWFYDTWASDAEAWNVKDPNEEAPVLYCSFPSLKDPHHDAGAELLHTGEVVTFVPYELFSEWRDGRWHHRGDEYEALKQQVHDRLLAQFFRKWPALKPFLAYSELSTPVSTEHFTRAPGGAIYGIEPTPERYKTSALRPRTPLPGLLLSGADVATVGVIGAMAGGVLAAVAAEPARSVRWLRDAVSRKP